MRIACALLVLLVTGCGLLFPPEPVGFREYELRGVSYEEAQSIVRQVTARVFAERFGGGFSIDWDDEQRNLKVSPVYDASRRLLMYIHLVPGDGATTVEMLALVEHIVDESDPAAMWGEPKQDVYFEQTLYDAFLVELLERQG